MLAGDLRQCSDLKWLSVLLYDPEAQQELSNQEASETVYECNTNFTNYTPLNATGN